MAFAGGGLVSLSGNAAFASAFALASGLQLASIPALLKLDMRSLTGEAPAAVEVVEPGEVKLAGEAPAAAGAVPHQ